MATTTPVPPDPSPIEAASIEERLDAVLESTEGIRVEIKTENERRDAQDRANKEAIRKSKRLGRVGIGVGVVGLVVAIVAVTFGIRASNDLHAFKSQIQTARRSGCIESNNQQRRSILGAEKGERTTINALLAAFKAPSNTPTVVAFYAKYDAQQEGNFPRRGCTPAALEAYRKGLPPSTYTYRPPPKH